jgi:predicted nucleic acid-binding protein
MQVVVVATIRAMDALIAATAHDLTLVTRNSAGFEASVKSILNPRSYQRMI